MPHAFILRGLDAENNFLDEFSVTREFSPVDPTHEDFYRRGMTQLKPPNAPMTDDEEIEKIYRQVPKLTSLDEYGNYLAQNPFSHGSGITNSFSIDFFRIFFTPSHFSLDQLDSFLNSIPLPPWLIKRGRGQFNLVHQGVSFNGYFRKFFFNKYYSGCMFQINQPDRSILDHLHQITKGQYIVSTVEFTTDMFCNAPATLFGLIKNTMTVKWPGRQLNLAVNTLYANNIRKNRSKGARAYIKKINGQYAVRVEMVIKRRRFKKMRIDTIPAACQLTGDKVYDHLTFKQLKPRTIDRKIIKQCHKHITGEVADIPKAELVAMFCHATIADHLQLGIADMHRLTQGLLTRGVYLADHPFDAAFANMVVGATFV